MKTLQFDNLTTSEPLQSNNFTYVSIETLRNAFPKVQGQSVTEPVKAIDAATRKTAQPKK